MTIQETTFQPKTYITLKKSIPMSQVSDKEMYSAATQKLMTYIESHGLQIAGPWTVMYFTWDSENEKTDIGIAFPVSNPAPVDDEEFSIVELPEAKASMSTLEGSYDGLAQAHQAQMDNVKAQAHTPDVNMPVFALEEYRVHPMHDENPENWKTDIYYFHS